MPAVIGTQTIHKDSVLHLARHLIPLDIQHEGCILFQTFQS